MKDAVKTTIKSTPETDIVTGNDRVQRWKPTTGSKLNIKMPDSPTPDTVELTPTPAQTPQTGTQTGMGTTTPTTQGKTQTQSNLRFTVEFKRKDGQVLEPYLPTADNKPKVILNTLSSSLCFNSNILRLT